MTRLEFFKKSAFGVTALLVIGVGAIANQPQKEKRTILYADGEHDDTVALQAWCDEKLVYFPDGRQVDPAMLEGLIFCTRGLNMSHGPNTIKKSIAECCFFGPGHWNQEAFINRAKARSRA